MVKQSTADKDKNIKRNLDLDFYESVIIFNSLTDPSYLGSIIDFIELKYFKNKDIQNIFSIIKDFFVKNNTIPTNSEIKAYLNTEELKTSFKKVVSSFSDIDKKFLKSELLANTEAFLKEKAVYHSLLDAAEKLDSRSLNTAELVLKFEKSVNINLTQSLGLDLFKDVDVFLAELNKEENHVKTGWKWLDNKLGGGFLENGRALYVFAGETNVGKSVFLGNVASNIAMAGKTVLLISLEMSENMYARRLFSNITKIPLSRLKEESETLKSQINEIGKEKPGKIIIKEFPPSTLTPQQLKGFLLKLGQKGIKLDAIVLDYLNLLGSSVGTNSYERILYCAQQVRAISYEINCPIISATQLNRSGFNIDNPGLETISESIGLATTADSIMSIWQKDEDKELGLINLGMSKNRFGPNFGSIALKIDYSTLTISEDETINESDEAKDFTRTLSSLGGIS
jgi:replicative DNA helicase